MRSNIRQVSEIFMDFMHRTSQEETNKNLWDRISTRIYAHECEILGLLNNKHYVYNKWIRSTTFVAETF